MLKLCDNCLEIYDGFETNVYCPKRSCETDGALVEIDDLLIDVIRKFWSIDISTAYCCSGHLYEKYFSPYIIFYAYQCDVENLKEVSEWKLIELKEVYKVFHRFQEEGIMVGEIVRIKRGYGFTVRADIDPINEQLSPQERLKIQYNFLNFLYKFIDEFEKASCGKIIKFANKEEPSLLQI
jgi:hypothetical protein